MRTFFAMLTIACVATVFVCAAVTDPASVTVADIAVAALAVLAAIVTHELAAFRDSDNLE